MKYHQNLLNFYSNVSIISAKKLLFCFPILILADEEIKRIFQEQEVIKMNIAKQNEFKKEVNDQLKLQQDHMMKKIEQFIQEQQKEINEIKNKIQLNENNMNDF